MLALVPAAPPLARAAASHFRKIDGHGFFHRRVMATLPLPSSPPQYLSTPIWILRLGGVGTAEVPTPGKSAMRPVCGHGAVRLHGGGDRRNGGSIGSLASPPGRNARRQFCKVGSRAQAAWAARVMTPSRRAASGAMPGRSRLRHHQRAHGAGSSTSPPGCNRARKSRDPEFSWHAPNGRRDRLAEPVTMVPACTLRKFWVARVSCLKNFRLRLVLQLLTWCGGPRNDTYKNIPEVSATQSLALFGPAGDCVANIEKLHKYP